ncbi:MAG: S41 family peptidase [Acidobacteriota bacterium]
MPFARTATEGNMKVLYTLTLFALFGLSAYAQAPVAAVATAPDSAAALRLESFNKVWNTVNDRHYDPTFGGVDWKQVGETYRPKALAAATDDELYSVLRKMLGELKLSHFGIYPKDMAAQIAGAASIGVELKIIDGQPVIEYVEPGSTAQIARLKPGFIVTKIGGTPTGDLLKPLENSFAGRSLSDRMKMVYRERTLEAFISGSAGSTASVEVLNAADKRQVFEAIRKPFAGEMSKPLGNFPPQPVIFESKLLPENIGYIRFNMWVIPQMANLRTAIRGFSSARAIIFDLRGNPGGVGGMASGIAGLMVAKESSLGTMRSRNGSSDFTIFPQTDPYQGTIVILTDYGTGSTSEVFAAGMQDIGRATVIGGTTAGAVLPSVFDKLPTGAIFQYAISDYRTPKNILLEGRGVIPDITVSQTRKSLLADRDAQLEAAVNFINTRNSVK